MISRTRSLGLAIAIIMVSLAGCASSDLPGAETAILRTEALVDMKDMMYTPATVTIAVGGSVTWTNQDDVGHTVTPADKTQWGTEGSGDEFETWLQQGQSWSFTFTKAGTYKYYCIPHASKRSDGEYRGMVGTVLVKEASA